MRISTFGYVGKQGVKNIWRNKMFSLASVATMSACIFLFGLFFSIILNFQYIIKMAEEGVAITVFFEEDATQAQIDDIGEALRGRDDVSEVNYISAEEAWESYQQEYFKDKPELAEGFANDNPLANSDHYEVYMKTSEDAKNLTARSKSLASTQQDLVKFAKSLDLSLIHICSFASFKRLMISHEFVGSKFPVGSSANKIAGSFTIALAIATRCCSPPDSSFGKDLYFCASPTSDSAAGTFLLITLVGVSVTRSAKAIFS